jgi:DNA-binding MarR family transcriptional regulator
MTTEKDRNQARILFAFGKRMRNHMFRTLMEARNSASGKIHEDLSPPQIHMLLRIRNQGQCTISELAALLDVSPPSVSAMVDRLVDKGALVRERSKEDRRVVAVQLSDNASKHVGNIEEAMLESFVKIIEKVGPELAEKWCTVVDQVDRALGEEGR